MSAQLMHETVPAATIEPAATTSRGPLGRAWNRILLAVREMNYAARRIVEVQAPWTVDGQRQRG
jgi:hypothetical protein